MPLPRLTNEIVTASDTSRVVVYDANADTTGAPTRIAVIVGDSLARKAELSNVLAEALVIEQHADLNLTLVRMEALVDDWRNIYPRFKPPLPPRRHFDAKRFSRRHGFAQAARLPCYRGSRTR